MPCRTALWHYALLFLLVCLPPLASSFFMVPGISSVSRASSPAGRSGAARPMAAAAEGGQETPPRVRKSLDRSAPPVFIIKNDVKFDGEFLVNKEGEPTAEELSNENLLKILGEKCTDEQMNWLLWKCLGYRYNAVEQTWRADEVFPKWKAMYPEPPDVLGVSRVYEKDVDAPVMAAIQTLAKTVPKVHKRHIVDHLRPLGFTGLITDELTPNRTRRAQATNFMLYYREQLWGVSLEELQRRREEEKANATAAEAANPPRRGHDLREG